MPRVGIWMMLEFARMELKRVRSYQGDDFHEAPKGEEDSEDHGCDLAKKLAMMVLNVCDSSRYCEVLYG